jgi:Tyrosine phosphatase family
MIKDDHKYAQLTFCDVLSGGICCLHRPSKNGISILSQYKCNVVVSLLSPSENPHEIGNACKALGLKWLWVPLQGANKKLLESNNAAWIIRKALIEAKDLLMGGNYILIHCAAGIHRTGLFTYALLRICGYDKERTLSTIEKVRSVTYEKCGSKRFELAEALAIQILANSITEEIKELEQLNSVSFVPDPLVWVRLTPTHTEKIRFECIITDKLALNYILGPNINLNISFGYVLKTLGEDWVTQKEPKYLPGGIIKNFKVFGQELLQFFNDSFPQFIGVIIGKTPVLEQRFIKAFWPGVYEYLDRAVIDTSFFSEIYGEESSETVYQEILNFKVLKETESKEI